MFQLFLYGFIFSLFFAFFLCALIGWFVWRFVKRRAKRRKVRLGGFQRRLKIVVAELLTYSNEMDQVSKYVGLDKDAAWSKKYRESLNRLLSASEKLTDSQTFLDADELSAAQECLLFVARCCYQVWREFKAIKPKESFDSLHQFSEESSKSDSGPIPRLKAPPIENGIHPSAFVDGEEATQNEPVERDEGVIIRLPKEKKKNSQT